MLQGLEIGTMVWNLVYLQAGSTLQQAPSAKVCLQAFYFDFEKKQKTKN
jgi:hypothetical protein